MRGKAVYTCFQAAASSKASCEAPAFLGPQCAHSAVGMSFLPSSLSLSSVMIIVAIAGTEHRVTTPH